MIGRRKSNVEGIGVEKITLGAEKNKEPWAIPGYMELQLHSCPIESAAAILKTQPTR